MKKIGPNTPPGTPHPSETLEATNFVAVNNANLAAINFTATKGISVDVTTSRDGSSKSTTIASSTFSTASANELLLAFVSADYLGGANTTVQGSLNTAANSVPSSDGGTAAQRFFGGGFGAGGASRG